MGPSVAIDLARSPPTNSKQSVFLFLCHVRRVALNLDPALMPAWGSWTPDASTVFASTYSARHYHLGQMNAAAQCKQNQQSSVGLAKERTAVDSTKAELTSIDERTDNSAQRSSPAALRQLLYSAAARIISDSVVSLD